MSVRYLYVSGRLYPDNRLEIRPSYQTENARGFDDQKTSALQIELVRGNDILLRCGAHLLDARSCLGGRPHPVKAVRAKVPFRGDADAIVFRHDNIVIHRITIPPSGPELATPAITSAKSGHKLAWSAKHSHGLKTWFNVRASADGGRNWYRLASRLDKPELLIPREQLLGDPDCIVEVIAYDGVHTTASKLVVKDVPQVRLDVRVVPSKVSVDVGEIVRIRVLAHQLGTWGYYNEGVDLEWRVNDKLAARGEYFEHRFDQECDVEVVVAAKNKRFDERAKAVVHVRHKKVGKA
jgi:hypothetical protein